MSKLFNGTYRVECVELVDKVTGERTPLPSVTNFTMSVPAETRALFGGREIRLDEWDMTFTVELSPADWERLQWVLGIHWLWVKYRRGLN